MINYDVEFSSFTRVLKCQRDYSCIDFLYAYRMVDAMNENYIVKHRRVVALLHIPNYCYIFLKRSKLFVFIQPRIGILMLAIKKLFMIKGDINFQINPEYLILLHENTFIYTFVYGCWSSSTNEYLDSFGLFIFLRLITMQF